MLRILGIILAALVLTACSSLSSRMQDLEIGMSEEQVKSTLGSDYTVEATALQKDGRKVTAWRYQESDKDPAYLVYFVNGKVAQYGSENALRNIPEMGNPHAN